MRSLLEEIGGCTICENALPHPPRPIIAASSRSRILLIGQAPGRKVHESGIPWHDKSGELLREWMGLGDDAFYDPDVVAIVPMGFCYPGKGKSGDLPPRPECHEAWHERVMSSLKSVELTLLIGKYAQEAYLGENTKGNLTETVKSFEQYLPDLIPLPHPSPRNRIWLKKNPWFTSEVLPLLRDKVRQVTSQS